MKIFDFLTRVKAAGGDVMRISYRFPKESTDRGVRKVLSFDSKGLKVCNIDKRDTFYAIKAFLYDRDYDISIQSMPLRKGLVDDDSRPVMLDLCKK